jgi:hypothetical protein
MIKIIYRSIISLILILLIIVVYLSTIGVKTNKFNSNIISQIKQIEPNIELKLNDVSATLDPFNFEINAKTSGTDLTYGNKIINIQTIKSNISISSFLNDKFALTGISISTKTLNIKDLISFVRLMNNDPKLFIAEQFINNGYLVADLKLEFDELGNVKNNYKFNGLVKDGEISLFKKYDLNKIDFIFKIDEKNLKFNDIKLFLNNKNILIPELIALKENKEYSILGKFNTKNISLTKNEINKLINDEFLELDIKKILFSSNSNFQFKINKNLKVNNFEIKSDIDLKSFKLKNSLKLENIFPEIKKNLTFKNQKIKLEYKNDNLTIDGKGEIFLQNELDLIEYKIYKKKGEVRFNTTLNISKNQFKIDLLNYKKDENSNLKLNFQGKNNIKKKLIFDEISLKEKNDIISIKKLILTADNKIVDIGNINIDYFDKDNLKNDLQITKRNKDYLISGNSFNADKIIERLLNSKNDKKSEFFDKNLKFVFNIKKINLDKNNDINDLKGFLSLEKNVISELNLESKFSNQKNIKLTIKNNGKEKITTLFSHEARPLVERYKFIKGFEEGNLDFYSIKKNGITNSTLKIDNFKIKEIPALAKLLILASLQGIADLLTGEGIRFTDFEMKFSSKDGLMTIDELYAIGPAISILMDGYIESNKLISLRGTLVPATTVNRTISSIPLIGDILVGKKIGEGVFGVSFKIKGPPKNLETTVNPIKTLTPRFITRTLEKIKKN